MLSDNLTITADEQECRVDGALGPFVQLRHPNDNIDFCLLCRLAELLRLDPRDFDSAGDVGGAGLPSERGW